MKSTISPLLILAVSPLGFAADRPRLAEEEDIREAVFRHQLEFHARDKNKIYFLGVGEKAVDASPELMKRFANQRPAVKKASDSQYIQGKGIIDKKTGERGLALMARTIKWISDTEVEVRGGYFRDEEAAASNTYRVRKQDGRWKVTKDKRNWIS